MKINETKKVKSFLSDFALKFDRYLISFIPKKKFFSNNKILPLEGIPMAIKDEEDIKGQPNTNGSLILKNHRLHDEMILSKGLTKP